MVQERLQKIIAAAGVTSRRKAEDLIRDGHVLLNGVVVTKLGTKANPAVDEILVGGHPIVLPRTHVYLAYNKPRGMVCTLNDPQGRPTVAKAFRDVGRRIYPVGRLDYDSEGLLLVTDDGDWAHRMMHPSHGWEKIYHAKVKGCPSGDVLVQLRRGVRLDDGQARAIRVSMLKRLQANTWLEIVVEEGRKRLVRRLCERVGHPVQRLRRVQMGPYRLGKLPVGRHQPVNPALAAKRER